MLQATRSRVGDPMRSLNFFFNLQNHSLLYIFGTEGKLRVTSLFNFFSELL
jgi:hypothetical protein